MDPGVLSEAVDVLIPITAFAMVAAIVIVPRYFKSLERQKMAETVRIAIEKGQPLPPEVVEALTSGGASREPAPQRDLRRGATLIAGALGIAVLGLVVGHGEHQVVHPLVGVAAIPGFIGLALIVIYLLEKPRT
jgi:hypothetical protein